MGSIESQELEHQTKYSGRRLTFRFAIGQPKTEIQRLGKIIFDIGDGDIITPSARIEISKTLIDFQRRIELRLGVYPDVGLRKAREHRDEFRKLVADNADPSENRKAAKATSIENTNNSFETVAHEWLSKHGKNWAPTHSDRTLRRLERDTFPWIK
jgi:hypothetical protein